jgi:hypothetical protein
MGTSPFILKIALNLLAIFGIIITFKVVFGDKGMLSAFFYLIATIVSSFFYRIKQTTPDD